MQTLFDWGWTADLADHFDQLAHDSLLPARVVRQDRQQYLVRSCARMHTAFLLGKMQYATSDPSRMPAVGDWAAIEAFDDEQAIIHAVLPRFSAFMRKEAGGRTRQQVIAANIDTVFLVSGLDHDFNLRRIERYLVQAASSGATPVIVLNKADLCDDVAARLAEVQQVASGVAVIVLSAQSGEGVEHLQAHIAPGQTIAVLGSSGVGKSTLVNRLLGADRQVTGAVREDDSRGRHTTSHRELFLLPEGGILIDTPGLRELQLWADASSLDATFVDIEALAAACRFKDCSHEVEPGCAVQEALATGDLDAERFQSYLKLRREIRYLDQRQDEVARAQAKQREKQFGKLVKKINRENPKRQ
ncbi:MAG TPA: ribosome small subunit-dependent GTPase A [Rhodothermales bacterium]|nr:ribosome small subunit-dependent GTPase A [Rhodothermales bacterium]